MGSPGYGEIEVSLFGPGLGESVVLHIGGGEWIIVDSCRNPRTGQPVALEYLSALEVDCAEAVVAILITHWDSDHIRGIGDVARACPRARVWCSAAIDHGEFDALLDLEAAEPGATAGRVREILRLREVCDGDGGQGLSWAKANSRLLHRRSDGELPARELWALSPSDYAVSANLRVLRELSRDPDVRLPRSMSRLTRNDASVALMLRAGDQAVLLGADLEHSTDDRRGWPAAIRFAREFGVRPGLVKVPHHGSEDAHCDEMWLDFLEAGPAAAVSPYRSGGNELPRPTDRERIRGFTDRAYLTSAGASSDFGELLLDAIEDVEAVRVEGDVGHVRWRRCVAEGADWEVQLDAASCSL